MGARDKLKSQKPKKSKEDSFIRTKMWISYLTSLITRDRGKIPDNIGSNVLITNNLYITKSYMSELIQVCTLSLDTPKAWTEDILVELRKQGSNAICDFTFKNSPKDIRLKDSGLQSRINLWENLMTDDNIHDREKERAARCLYTVDIAREGAKLADTRCFITLRAKTGYDLTVAEKIVYSYLTKIGAEYLPVSSDIKSKLSYLSLIADHRDKAFKDVQAITTSEKTFAEMLPNTMGFNGAKGLYLGINLVNNSQFMVDLSSITMARNIYVVAPSGVGKTVVANNFICSGFEQGWSVCIMDIKGNEFTRFTEATGGYTVSLTPSSQEYINSFRLIKADCTDEAAEMYYKSRVQFSKKQIEILSGVDGASNLNELSELLDELLDTLYVSRGVLPDNRNTWSGTFDLNPYTIYDYIVSYVGPSIQERYPNVARTLLTSLKMYWTPSGSMSYMFRKEFDYTQVLRAPVLTFNFGILEGAQSTMDLNLFRLKFLYMQKFNAEFITYKHSKGIYVLKVLEEVQVVNDAIMEAYVQEWTLRRAQGQSTILLGNSVSALLNNKLAGPIVENVKALLVGRLPQEARDAVVKQFDLQKYAEALRLMQDTKEFANSFMFINMMQTESLTPIVKLHLKEGQPYSLIKPVEQKNNAAG